MHETPIIEWTDQDGHAHASRWVCDNDRTAPEHVILVDDRMPADLAYRHACEGTGLIWQGDYHNARHLLQALTRRLERVSGRNRPGKARAATPSADAAIHPLNAAFYRQRQLQAQRARVLGMLLIPVSAGDLIPLRRAPSVAEACAQAQGAATTEYLTPLRHMLGVIGAHEWRKAGVFIPALQQRIHAHYGVFSPVRGEYLQLVAQTPLPVACTGPTGLAFDIGTGTGVLAAILAQRAVHRIIATDTESRALNCARDNLERLGVAAAVELQQTNLFPEHRQADLIVCNPPWLPGKPNSSLEHAIYDPDSRMLRGFIQGVKAHLRPNGEAWLILSDLAEHLHLRSRTVLTDMIAAAGLCILGRHDVRPVHHRAHDPQDALHAARSAEITSLWRLAAQNPSASLKQQ
jgi:methylase of polypeptide subunit release factors